MKKLLLMAAVCWLGAQAHTAEWLTDLPKALAQAKAEKKWVFMDFTGSDWCPPCMALHKNVLISPEFTAYAGTNFVLVLVDFPNSKPQSDELKKANAALKEKYGIEGFPTVIVLDADRKVLDKALGYNDEKPKQFIANLEKLKQKPAS